MTTVYLVSCGKSKLPLACAAQDLYQGDLFVKARAYAERRGPWFILSAKYGLVPPTRVLAPYDQTLIGAPDATKRAWAEQVRAQLRTAVPHLTEAVFLAGREYRKYLGDLLRADGITVTVPMEGLGLGQQKQWLLKNPQDPSRQVIEFYTSGLTGTPRDAAGVIMAGGLPGIIAATKRAKTPIVYERKLPRWAASYLASGGKLFCDSGAFTAAFSGSLLDFNKVFAFYDLLLRACANPAQLLLVMPDSIAQQEVTLQLWAHHRRDIERLLDSGCTCLFALQCAEHTMTDQGPVLRSARLSRLEMYRAACDLFGRDDLAAAIPMRKNPPTAEAIGEFVREARPPHLHLLGLGRGPKAVAAATATLRANPSIVVTADAVESTTAFSGRHRFVPRAFREKVEARAARKRAYGAKRRDIWWADRQTKTAQEEMDWWLPLPTDGPGAAEQFATSVQALTQKALADGTITAAQAALARSSPEFARQLFLGHFRPVDSITAFALHLLGRMQEYPVPSVSEVLR